MSEDDWPPMPFYFCGTPFLDDMDELIMALTADVEPERLEYYREFLWQALQRRRDEDVETLRRLAAGEDPATLHDRMRPLPYYVVPPGPVRRALKTWPRFAQVPITREDCTAAEIAVAEPIAAGIRRGEVLPIEYDGVDVVRILLGEADWRAYLDRIGAYCLPPGPELRAYLTAHGRNYGLDAFTPEERAEMAAVDALVTKIVDEMLREHRSAEQEES